MIAVCTSNTIRYDNVANPRMMMKRNPGVGTKVRNNQPQHFYWTFLKVRRTGPSALLIIRSTRMSNAWLYTTYLPPILLVFIIISSIFNIINNCDLWRRDRFRVRLCHTASKLPPSNHVGHRSRDDPGVNEFEPQNLRRCHRKAQVVFAFGYISYLGSPNLSS